MGVWWESVDTPDLKSVDHYGRGGSSPPTPTYLILRGKNENQSLV